MKIVVTIGSLNLKPEMRAVLESFCAFHPEYQPYCLYLESCDKNQLIPSVRPIFIEDLGLDSSIEWRFKYDVRCLAAALRPYLHEALFLQYGADEIVYIDSDLLFLRKMDDLSIIHQDHSIALTPCMLKDPPLDGKKPGDEVYRLTGMYNGGFLALKKDDSTMAFLTWWKEKLNLYSVHYVDRGYFGDQKYLDVVPLYWGVNILKSPALNVAFWNVHERHLTLKDDIFYSNNIPLVFFHFSGFESNRPDLLTRAAFERVEDVDPMVIQRLKEKYLSLMVNSCGGTNQEVRYFFNRFSNQLPIHPETRDYYRFLPSSLKPSDPFNSIELMTHTISKNLEDKLLRRGLRYFEKIGKPFCAILGGMITFIFPQKLLRKF